jgi:hypothetical protein
MGKNRRSKQRARELQAAKTNTIILNNHGVAMTDQPMYQTPDTEATKIVGDYDVEPVPEDTTLVEAIVVADADVVKAASIPFSVRLLNFIRNAGMNGVTMHDIYVWVPDAKPSTVRARITDLRKQGKVMDYGDRIIATEA